MIRSLACPIVCMFLLDARFAHAQSDPEVSPPPPPPTAPAQTSTSAPEALPAPEPPRLGFRAALAPYGTWTTLAPYGEVWVPRGMPATWRPYTTGHWVFTDAAGWTWVADEPWGWAAFHYGRWTMDPALGWVWISGNVWAPAWVTWRECDGFVGWAPLPPCVTWTAGVGLVFGGVDLALVLGSPCWSFVPTGHFCHPHVCEVLLVPERVLVVLRGSRIVERGLLLENGRPANRAFAVEEIEKASGTTVKHVVLRDVDRPESVRAATVGPDEVAVYRPRARARAAGQAVRTTARAPEHPRPPVHATPATEPPAKSGQAPAHAQHQQRDHLRNAQHAG